MLNIHKIIKLFDSHFLLSSHDYSFPSWFENRGVPLSSLLDHGRFICESVGTAVANGDAEDDHHVLRN